MTGPDVRDAAPVVVVIEGEMTIWRAAELKQALLEPLDRAGPVEVDLSRVSEVDTAGVQLLMFARLTADARCRRFRVVRQSEAVTAVLALLRLAAFFEGAPPPGAAG